MRHAARGARRDPWEWTAIYADDTALAEHDADAPDGRSFAEAVRYGEARGVALARVVLTPTRDGLPAHVALAAAGATVSVFRRRTLTVDMSGAGAGAGGPDGEPVEVGERPDPVTVLGLRWPDGRAAYTFLFADGSVLVSADLNAA